MSDDFDFDDFGFDIGEAAYHHDEEVKKVEDESPEDAWEKEFEQMDEEVV